MPITPFSTPQELAALAAAHPELGAAIAQHPNAYDGLLDWLAQYGDDAARAAVRVRRTQPPPLTPVPESAGPPATPETVFRPIGAASAVAAPTVVPPTQPPAAPLAAPPEQTSAAPRQRHLPIILGIGVGVVALGVAAAFAVGPIQGMFAGGSPQSSVSDPASSNPTPGVPEAPESFDLPDAPTFADGVDIAWELSLSELQPTGEDPGFHGYADYGDFWLVSTHEFFGDLAHGGKATAVDSATGKVLWSIPDGAAERNCADRLIGGRLICTHSDGSERVIENIDPRTGVVTVEPGPGFPVAAVAALEDSYLVAGFDDYESMTTRLARVRPGGKVEWRSEIQGRCTSWELYDQNRLSLQRYSGFLVLNLNYCLGAILDPATGKVADAFAATNLTAHPGGFTAGLPSCLSEYGNPEECSGAAARSVDEASVPGGGRLPVRHGISYGHGYGYIWSGTDARLDPEPAAWYFAGQDDCYLDSIVEVASGRSLWQSTEDRLGFCPLQVGEGSSARAAFFADDGKGGDLLTLFDPAAGRTVWQQDGRTKLTRSHDTFGYFSESPDSRTIVVADDHGLNAFATADGHVAWQGFRALKGESWWRVVPGPDGASLVQETGNRIARLVPAVAPTRVAAMPADIPDCPRGWTPVSFSAWQGGHTLVCSAGSRTTYYLEYADGTTVYRSSEGTSTPTGWTWTPQPGHEVTVSFFGVLVQVSVDGTTTSRFPADAWRDGAMTGFAAPPADLPRCPAGSWPLSLSVWQGGWLLTCGTAAGQPSSMYLAEGGTLRQATGVTFDGAAYCARLGQGTVCAYPAPALVSVHSAAGEVTQHSVTENWFAETGRGGAGEGTGSYGVDAPEATTADQLRYLDQILARSKKARKTLSPAINDVLACKKLDSAVKRIDAVTANRDELLAALDSTPVDALAEGQRLVADLRYVLELSRATDQGYADWAREERDNGCTGGTSSQAWKLAKAADDAVDAPKDAFVDYWNTEIAPAHGVRKLTNSDI